MLFADMIDEAGFPPGVFNLVNGIGEEAGAALAAHPEVDMISFTGSTKAGRAVSIAAAETVKRVTLELGGKSPLIIFEDADLEAAVKRGVKSCFINSGQSCNAPTRMLVEAPVYERVLELVKDLTARREAGRSGVRGLSPRTVGECRPNSKKCRPLLNPESTRERRLWPAVQESRMGLRTVIT